MSRLLQYPILIVALTTLTAPFGWAQSSQTVRDRFVEATLVSEVQQVKAGQPFRVGLLLKHDPHWHTYWKSSATGYATSIEWDLPEGFEAGPIEWPAPTIYQFQDWTEYVYEGETLLVVTISPPDSVETDAVTLGFRADWLMCENVCVPGGAESALQLPTSSRAPQLSAKWAPLFVQHDQGKPIAPGEIQFEAWKAGSAIELRASGENLPPSAFFFDDQGVIEPMSGESISEQNSLRWRLLINDSTEATPDKLTGILRPGIAGEWNSNQSPLIVDIAVLPAPPSEPAQEITSMGGILLLAFVGGLILNLMPCVFPVLGIKIMGFVNQAGESRAKVVGHGLVFSAGVLISFWVLAIVLIVLRSSGNQLGWGFQLQSPVFVFVLTVLLFAFALNMSGLFEIGQSAIGVGSGLTAKSGLTGSFFSGVLATVVATPCAAPFLAPALGAALTLPPLSSLLVFSFIAMGLATPYLMLSSFPSLINRLPRPGAWMETFKQFMSFLLYATVAYLLWVLAGQLTDAGGFGGFSFLKVLLSLVVVAMGLWVFGRWGAYHRPKMARMRAIGTALILMVGAVWLGLSGTVRLPDGDYPIRWKSWEPGLAEQLAEAGETVYVDFTARWCVTCQTNKATVFSSRAVRELLSKHDVVLLKADWTHRDERISEALAAYGRSAVPFNLVFGPALDQPLVLPEILTPGAVIKAIEAAGDN